MIDMLHKIALKTITVTDGLVAYKKGDKLKPVLPCYCSALDTERSDGSIFLLHRTKQNSEKWSQYGFCPGRGTVDAIYVVRQIMQTAKERNVDHHLHFIDFKAAFDTVLMHCGK